MLIDVISITWTVALLLLTTTAAKAQETELNAPFVLPESPNSAPMEAVWDYAPEAPGGNLTSTGPYRISRWGNIVVRGRLEEGRVISALTFIQCGRDQDPALQVTLIGEAPDDLCDSVEPLPEGKLIATSGEKFDLYGQSTGWTVLDFAQVIDNSTFETGINPVVAGRTEDGWGVTSLSAVFHNENGRHVFYAPGETVQLPGGDSFVVKPVMEQEEIEALVIGDALAATSAQLDKLFSATEKQETPPPWFAFLFFGIPILLIGGLVYGVVRFFRRKKIRASPQCTGALPTPREALREPDPPENH